MEAKAETKIVLEIISTIANGSIDIIDLSAFSSFSI